MKHLNQTWLTSHKRFFQNTKCIFNNRTTFKNVCWTIVQGSNDFFCFEKGHYPINQRVDFVTQNVWRKFMLWTSFNIKKPIVLCFPMQTRLAQNSWIIDLHKTHESLTLLGKPTNILVNFLLQSTIAKASCFVIIIIFGIFTFGFQDRDACTINCTLHI